MNNKQAKTMAAIFHQPTKSDIRWTAIESLFRALGATVSTKREGSRVRVELNGQEATLHMPHPRPTAHKFLVEDIRELLTRAGVKP